MEKKYRKEKMFDYTENSMIINNSLLINHGGGGDLIMQLYTSYTHMHVCIYRVFFYIKYI
jgi:hypothetical protein